MLRAGEPIVGLSIHRDDAERLCHREHPPLSLPAIVMPTLNAVMCSFDESLHAGLSARACPRTHLIFIQGTYAQVAAAILHKFIVLSH